MKETGDRREESGARTGEAQSSIDLRLGKMLSQISMTETVIRDQWDRIPITPMREWMDGKGISMKLAIDSLRAYNNQEFSAAMSKINQTVMDAARELGVIDANGYLVDDKRVGCTFDE